jgi:AAHS family 4-hydroxybenzoate transporter-like MFS transporter
MQHFRSDVRAAFVQGVQADLFVVAGAGLFILGAQVLLNNFTAASYETEVRSTAVGSMLGIARLGAIAGPIVGGVLQQRFIGANGLFGAIALASIAGALFIVLARPSIRPVPDAAPATAASH